MSNTNFTKEGQNNKFHPGATCFRENVNVYVRTHSLSNVNLPLSALGFSAGLANNVAIIKLMVYFSLVPPVVARLILFLSLVSILSCLIQHVVKDVIPHQNCCSKCVNMCNTYYKFRPSDDCSRFNGGKTTV